MGYRVLVLAFLISQTAFAQVEPTQNLKFKIGLIEVTQLVCLQDRERHIGSQLWGPRQSSKFSMIIINKPSYLMAGDVNLKAYESIAPGLFQNSSQYTGVMKMRIFKDFLILTDNVAPQSWVVSLGVATTSGNSQIVNLVGAHIDRQRGVEYELDCTF